MTHFRRKLTTKQDQMWTFSPFGLSIQINNSQIHLSDIEANFLYSKIPKSHEHVLLNTMNKFEELTHYSVRFHENPYFIKIVCFWNQISHSTLGLCENVSIKFAIIAENYYFSTKYSNNKYSFHLTNRWNCLINSFHRV